MLPLDAIDEEHLGLRAQVTAHNAKADVDKTLIYDDVTLGQARIMAGTLARKTGAE